MQTQQKPVENPSVFMNRKMKKYIKIYPLYLDHNNEEHILMFRRVLEIAMSQGRWTGFMADLS